MPTTADLDAPNPASPARPGRAAPTAARLLVPVRFDGVRILVCLSVWVVAACGSLLIAARTTVGPVVLDLSHNHGIHLGDVVAVLGGTLWAAVVTIAILVPVREHPATLQSGDRVLNHSNE